MDFEEICLISFWVLIFLIYSIIFEICSSKFKTKRVEYILTLNIITYFIIDEVINKHLFTSKEKTYVLPIIVTLLFWAGAYIYRKLKQMIKEMSDVK